MSLRTGFHFRKIYHRLEEGMMIDAIVCYARRPWWQEVRDDGTHLQYKHILVIDLWLCQLRFEWTDKNSTLQDL